MGIKYIEDKKLFQVSYSKRHPETRVPINRMRTHFVDRSGIRLKITTKAEARRVHNQLVLDVEEVIRRKTIPTWMRVLTEFEPYYLKTGVELKTVDTYMACLHKHTSEWYDLGIEKINDSMIRDLINSLASKSKSHQKNMLKFIRRVFVLALEKAYIDRNPTPNMKFKFGSKNAKVLTKIEASRLLSLSKEQGSKWHFHWLLALYTGMRNGELFALEWRDINFEKNLIQVRRSWNSKDGFKSTKSGDERIVPIASDLSVTLKELMLTSGEKNFVLPRLSKWTKGEQARELRMFLQGAGLPEVRFHDLRATWATLLLSNSVPPVKVMAMGGWKDIKTMIIYIRKAGVDVAGETDCLGLFSPEQNKGLDVLKFS